MVIQNRPVDPGSSQKTYQVFYKKLKNVSCEYNRLNG